MIRVVFGIIGVAASLLLMDAAVHGYCYLRGVDSRTWWLSHGIDPEQGLAGQKLTLKPQCRMADCDERPAHGQSDGYCPRHGGGS